MKLFHISDLHIGKILHEVNLLEEQKIVLAQVLALVDLHMPDGILIAEISMIRQCRRRGGKSI